MLAHVPNINDFVKAYSMLLKPNGIATFEFPHLLNLVNECQFDTIYHEHYSYLSLTVVRTIFEANGLAIFDVEELETHGGSLRVYAQRSDSGQQRETDAVRELESKERKSGISAIEFYQGFQGKAEKIKTDFISFLVSAKQQGKKVAAYGAVAKGNTIINYSGIRSDLLSYVADRNPAKQYTYMPGSRIPIADEDQLQLEKPDYVIILPWNLKVEVMSQLKYIERWGGRFVTAVPSLITA